MHNKDYFFTTNAKNVKIQKIINIIMKVMMMTSMNKQNIYPINVFFSVIFYVPHLTERKEIELARTDVELCN